MCIRDSFNIAAYHGQMPDHPSEAGFMVTNDLSIRALTEPHESIQIVDVAPTLLSLVGAASLPHMEGKKVFDA